MAFFTWKAGFPNLIRGKGIASNRDGSKKGETNLVPDRKWKVRIRNELYYRHGRKKTTDTDAEKIQKVLMSKILHPCFQLDLLF